MRECCPWYESDCDPCKSNCKTRTGESGSGYHLSENVNFYSGIEKSCPEKNVKGTFVGMRFVLRKAMLMNKRDSRFSKNESGAALVIALIMMIVLTLIGLASTFTSTFEIILSGEKKRSTDAFYDCERNLDQVLMVPVNFIPGESKAV
jgi:hypothetical protein